MIQKLYRSFPVQLLIMHLKYHQVLLFFWVLLFLIILGHFGKGFGIPYLYLDPEYLGKVNYLSFFIVGIAYGGFIITWHLTTYILNSHRFEFLAALQRPFLTYSLNNGIIPLAFLLTYVVKIWQFQSRNEFTGWTSIMLDMMGFLFGVILVLVFSALYFQWTNKNIIQILGLRLKRIPRKIRRKVILRPDLKWEEMQTGKSDFDVSLYLTTRLHLRPTRLVHHYDVKSLQTVFRQHHTNALIVQVATLMTLVGLGVAIEYEAFRIPSSASMLLFFSTLISLSGMLSFWLGQWRGLGFILLILALNFALRSEKLVHQNKVYGINYARPAEYNYQKLKELSSEPMVREDIGQTVAYLNHWKARTGLQKPKMVLLNLSGGGLAAAMFSMGMMQQIDSVLHGGLMKNTALITGASGGMFAGAFFRELYLQKQLGEPIDLHARKYTLDMGRDILNPVTFTILVNDIFYPWQVAEIGGYRYKKDRGYIFEQVLNENCNGLLDRPLREYRKYEESAFIPMMILIPNILNDARKLYISAMPVSYMTKPIASYPPPREFEIEGIDFMRFFSEQDAGGLLLTSALRMNGTFPYILPTPVLPSDPPMKVIDAGFRDNYGIETSIKFIHVFRDWIRENTSGVILVQIRGFKQSEIVDFKRETLLSKLFNPVRSVYANWDDFQIYLQSYLVEYADEWLEGNLEWVKFEYIPSKINEEAALSLHLTTREKLDILQAINNEANQTELERLKKLLSD